MPTTTDPKGRQEHWCEGCGQSAAFGYNGRWYCGWLSTRNDPQCKETGALPKTTKPAPPVPAPRPPVAPVSAKAKQPDLFG